MNKNKGHQEFDTIAFKRKVQIEISEEIKGLAPEEEIAYFRQASETGSLGRWWQSIKRVTTGTSR